jgi:general nucleoside transport system permease protein
MTNAPEPGTAPATGTDATGTAPATGTDATGADARMAGSAPATMAAGDGRHAAPTSEPAGPSLRRYLVDAWSANAVTVTLLAFLAAMAVGGILICVSDPTVRATFGYVFAAPGDAVSASWTAVRAAYADLFKGSIVDPDLVSQWVNGTKPFTAVLGSISETLTYATPIIFTGLAVALAFRGGLFNIGAQGQAIFGAIAAGVLGFGLDLPPVLALIVVLIGAALGGGLYGAIPGVLKARTGAHEVITTIMLNYVALLFLGWFITQKGIQNPDRSDAISKDVHGHALLPKPFGDSLRVNLGILLAVLAAAVVSWVLTRSTFGFELRAVGLNPDAARTAGMSVAGTYAMTMAVAGALAGLGGAAVLLGTAGHLTVAVVGNAGFDGITVALLGRGKAWGVVLAGLFWGALTAGGNRMQSFDSIPIDLIDLLKALIVLFIAAPALIRAVFRLRAARLGRLEANLAKGW